VNCGSIKLLGFPVSSESKNEKGIYFLEYIVRDVKTGDNIRVPDRREYQHIGSDLHEDNILFYIHGKRSIAKISIVFPND
jgi:hypothetical protein